MNEECDACCCGEQTTPCKKDVYDTIIDGCGRPLTYCSKYKCTFEPLQNTQEAQDGK